MVIRVATCGDAVGFLYPGEHVDHSHGKEEALFNFYKLSFGLLVSFLGSLSC